VNVAQHNFFDVQHNIFSCTTIFPVRAVDQQHEHDTIFPVRVVGQVWFKSSVALVGHHKITDGTDYDYNAYTATTYYYAQKSNILEKNAFSAEISDK